jgi:hypothetical protein
VNHGGQNFIVTTIGVSAQPVLLGPREQQGHLALLEQLAPQELAPLVQQGQLVNSVQQDLQVLQVQQESREQVLPEVQAQPDLREQLVLVALPVLPEQLVPRERELQVQQGQLVNSVQQDLQVLQVQQEPREQVLPEVQAQPDLLEQSVSQELLALQEQLEEY